MIAQCSGAGKSIVCLLCGFLRRSEGKQDGICKNWLEEQVGVEVREDDDTKHCSAIVALHRVTAISV